MDRPLLARQGTWLIPSALLMVAFGRLAAHPSWILADAARPTVDHARVVAASPGNDLTRQYWPLQVYVARSIARERHLPGWDDRGFGGRPLVGNPQAGLFYPPGWLAWLIPGPATLGWITVGHLIWAILGVRWLARTLGLTDRAAMVSAGCYAMAPYVLAQTFEGHYPHVWAASWYPLAFAATIRAGMGRRRAGLILAGCLAATLVVGHPQEAYYLAVAIGTWAGIVLIARGLAPGARRQVPGLVATGLAVGLLALGLAAAELIPDALAQGWGLKSARLPLRLASRYHPLAINLVQALNPFALGGPADYFGPENYWEAVLSVGLVPLVLAAVGATWAPDRRRVRPWIVLVILALAFAGGRRLGLFAACYDWIPGMDRFRVPARSLFLASLGTSILAGFGVEALGAAPGPGRDRWPRLLRAWAVAAAILAVAVGWGWRQAGRAGRALDSGGVPAAIEAAREGARRTTDGDRLAGALRRLAEQPVFGLAVAGLGLGLVAGAIWPGRRRQVALGLGLVGLVELAGSGWQLLVVGPPAAFLDPRPIEGAILALGLDGRAGPPVRLRADETLVSDLAAVDLGWTKTDINDSFQVQHAADLYQRLYDLSRPRPVESRRPMDGPVAERTERLQRAVLDRMAVDAAVGDARSPRLLHLFEAGRWPTVALASQPGGSGPVVGRNPTPLPRAYLVPRAEVGPDEGARTVDRFPDVDPRRAVLMTSDPLAGVDAGVARQGFRPVPWTAEGPDRLVLDATTTGPGLLVVADTWMPGWTARVDGRDAPIGRGNHAQRVVALPTPGRHRVVLDYRPPGLRLGAAISAGSAIAWLVLWRLARPRPGGSPGGPFT